MLTAACNYYWHQMVLQTAHAGRWMQVFEWLTWSSTELSSLTDDRLGKLNDYLASHTFLVGER
jgi:hypothetical protein